MACVELTARRLEREEMRLAEQIRLEVLEAQHQLAKRMAQEQRPERETPRK